jgi:low affinity Fe/Cu permease
MSSIHSAVENAFDRLTSVAVRVLGSSITFILAVAIVIYWFCTDDFLNQSAHEIIRDALLAVTFLSFFIVQKSVNRYSTALHLKLNELIASHDAASNKVVNIEEKTEEEIRAMAKKYEHISKSNDDSNV